MPNSQRAGKADQEAESYLDPCLRLVPAEQLAEAQESLDIARRNASILQQAKALSDRSAESPLVKFRRVWGE